MTTKLIKLLLFYVVGIFNFFRLKAKNSNPKKQWEQRFAFLTKTEDDYLEDGYKWRKYGKKALQNNYFPR
ncbi:putative transcription factor WRKY family [Helianthus annuus]|uniref:Transcription factor WRKY family n=2 Tax=Helianthus annuus TaxID=4232 RepID=A0A9K3I117_HELAN|nr:putative transcription factor WRKY family [Helianthus annuus]KAJ0515276.1 putative transcription factor WRKY family [Helianthus annuus]KAJ0523745.1 putative transcription factor WRKY family [Helianthus annuus]KAJ0531469.1 putative transcription factor WRKY family [Helianthus annuus]KAJ0698311.1 putative transcription factor WRKY family [Helianthus annuus]